MKTTLNVLCISALLGACGGGGGGSAGGTDVGANRAVSSNSVTAASSANAVAPQNPVVEQVSYLQTTREFEFVSTSELDFSVVDSQVQNNANAFSICRIDDQGKSDPNNCVVNGRLDGHFFASRIDIGNDIDQLVLTLYVFDRPLRVETANWNRAMGMQWHLSY